MSIGIDYKIFLKYFEKAESVSLIKIVGSQAIVVFWAMRIGAVDNGHIVFGNMFGVSTSHSVLF